MKFFSGLVIGILVAVAIPLALIQNGSINMSASEKASSVEKTLGTMAWEKYVHQNAPGAANPFAAGGSAVLAEGLAHYKDNCLVCHGVPGMKQSEIAEGMNPPPPLLNDLADMSDRELFFLIKNGIRMSGMPAFGSTHSDNEIWKTVAFVRHIPKITAQEREMLKPADEEEHHHEATETPAPVTPSKERPAKKHH